MSDPTPTARQLALERIQHAERAVQSAAQWPHSPMRTKRMTEALAELEAARRQMRQALDADVRRPVPVPVPPAVGDPSRPWGASRTRHKRVSGRVLQRARAALFQREPLCRECRRHHRDTLATIRDHIVPLAEGGTEDESNIQPLCQACSDAKTAREAARGRGRARTCSA